MSDLKPVLTWVNQEREKRAMKPLERLPKGRPRRSFRCPVAVALGDESRRPTAAVGPATWYPDLEGDECFPTPPLIAQFIHDFDNGKYPELVA